MYAYRNTRLGHDGTAKLLLDKRADVTAATNTGSTALIVASKKGHEGTEQLSSLGSIR